MAWFNFGTPTFTAVGPYDYTEMDTYANPQYGDTVTSTFTQTTTLANDPTGTIDTPMWMLNQGALKYWSQLNNKPHWMTYLQVLNAVVNEALGDFTEAYVPYWMMAENNIT